MDVTFYVDTPDLVITEIMPHPRCRPWSVHAGGLRVDRVHEHWREPLDLTGIHFISGIEVTLFPSGGFSLPPGERAVVIKTWGVRVRVRSRRRIEIAGEYVGNISNAGEFVGLEGHLNEPIQELVSRRRVAAHDGWPRTLAGHRRPLRSDLDVERGFELDDEPCRGSYTGRGRRARERRPTKPR